MGYCGAFYIQISTVFCYFVIFYLRLFEEDWNGNESWAYNKKSPLLVAAMIKVVPVKIRHAAITMKTRPTKRSMSTDVDNIPAGTEYSPWNGYQLPSLQVELLYYNTIRLYKHHSQDLHYFNCFLSLGDYRFW